MKKITLVLLFFCCFWVLPCEATMLSDIVEWTADFFGANCWTCKIYGGVFTAIDSMSTSMATALQSALLKIMTFGIMLVIAGKVLRVLMGFKETAPMSFLSDLVKSLGRSLVAALIIANTFTIYQYIINPLLDVSLSFSTAIIKTDTGTDYLATMKEIDGKNQTFVCESDENADWWCANMKSEGTALSKSVCTKLSKMLCEISTGIAATMVMGIHLILSSFSLALSDTLAVPILILIGLAVLVGAGMIFVAFPLKLMEPVFRLAFVCALGPLFVLLWVFPLTVSYSKEAIKLFVNVCAGFVTLSITVVLILNLLTFTFGTKESREKFIDAMVSGKTQELSELASGSGFVGAGLSLALCFVAFKLLAMSERVANAISPAPELGAGRALEAGAVGAAQLGGKAWGKRDSAYKAMGTVASWIPGGKTLLNATSRGANSMDAGAQALHSFVSKGKNIPIIGAAITPLSWMTKAGAGTTYRMKGLIDKMKEGAGIPSNSGEG